MNLKFLEKKFNEKEFKAFILKAFDEFELIDGNYRTDNLNESDREHITKYKYLGEAFLDDDSEVGVLICYSATKNIENKRVGFSKVISKLSKPYGKEIILVAIYHNNSPVWRLTFVSYDFKDGKQTTRTDAKRYTYVLGEDIALTTAKSRVGKLFDGLSTSQELIEEIFSVEKVSKEFFDKYKRLYADTLKELQPQIALFGDEKGLSLFTKKLLGRIVFLYFLQKKGWLASDENWENGDKKFLRNCFDEKYKEYDDFYTEILQPLFFEALNQDRAKDNDNFKLLNVRIPYLNGGLFMRDEFDKESRVFVENEIFEKIFGLFDQYNFTIIESNPNDSEVAIDPEMLGRIFEDLLEDRKEKGAFYTPREIVHYMCQESIKYYLQTKPKDKTELEYIKEMKILDPAIGSGAFPMGMLHEIVEKRLELGDKTDIATIKIETIQNSIYGIDIDASAVEIAQLRFWLSIVVDEKIPRALPNLDFKIMIGNSLIDNIYGEDPLKGRKNLDKKLDKLNKFFKAFYDPNSDKNRLREQIRKEIKGVFNLVSKQNSNQLTLEDSPKEAKRKLEEAYRAKYLNDILKDIQEKQHSDKIFLYKLFFRDVIKQGGFNIIIGNPPYVRQEKIRELKPKLKIERYKSYNGTADLYIYFFEQGYRLLKENGILNYITSNKWTRAKYGKNFREFILNNTAILEYIDFNGVKVFNSATVDTSIFSFRKVKKKNSSFIYCDINEKYRKENELEKFVSENGFKYLQSDLSVDSFSFSTPEELAIKKRIEEIGTPLKEWDIEINRGILTGFNDAFIIDGKIKDELIEKDPKSVEIIKPLLRGRDINRYGYTFADKWLINTHNGLKKVDLKPININNYHAIKEHLDIYYEKLKKRGDKGETPYNLRNCKFLDEFKKEKIIWTSISKINTFAYTNQEIFTNDKCFILTGNNLKYLVSLLNSKLFFYYYKFDGIQLSSGYEFKKFKVENVPVKRIPKQQQKPFEILVDKIIELKKEGKDTKELEDKIDRMVYKLYGLSNNEIKIIEESIKW